MVTTSLSLLDRLSQPGGHEAWDRFVRLYAPLLLHWARQQGLRDTDAEDLVQTVLLKLIRLLPGYRRQDAGTFRGWLFTVCRNECRDFRTRRTTRPLPDATGLSGVADEPGPDLEEAEYRRRMIRRGLELVRPDFSPATWAAFAGFVLEGRPAAEVAAAGGSSVNAVYLARNRVLTRLREELAGLLD